jgi:hypothetical protein
MSGQVGPAAARDAAAAYVDTPTTRDPLVAAAYAQLVTESDQLFRHLTSPDRPGRVHIAFTTCPAPYANADELIGSVRHDRLLEVDTLATKHDRHHPLMGNEFGGASDRFRAVHDVLGHARVGLGFDRDAEFAIWLWQERFHGPLARRALATELHGQHSVLRTTGDLAQPKAILLRPELLCGTRRLGKRADCSAASKRPPAGVPLPRPREPSALRPPPHRLAATRRHGKERSPWNT